MRVGGTRFGLYVVTLAVVFALNFALPRVMPGDPIDQLSDPASPSLLFDDQTRSRVLSLLRARPAAAGPGHRVSRPALPGPVLHLPQGDGRESFYTVGGMGGGVPTALNKALIATGKKVLAK